MLGVGKRMADYKSFNRLSHLFKELDISIDPEKYSTQIKKRVSLSSSRPSIYQTINAIADVLKLKFSERQSATFLKLVQLLQTQQCQDLDTLLDLFYYILQLEDSSDVMSPRPLDPLSILKNKSEQFDIDASFEYPVSDLTKVNSDRVDSILDASTLARTSTMGSYTVQPTPKLKSLFSTSFPMGEKVLDTDKPLESTLGNDKEGSYNRRSTEACLSETEKVSESSISVKSKVPVAIIGNLPIALQEYSILEDILFLMMGVEGKYIRIEKTNSQRGKKEITFIVDESLDKALAELASRMLPLACFFMEIDKFTEVFATPKYSLVMHALVSAIRDLLQDYLTLVAQLEHQFHTSPVFTLQKLWFYIHPTMKTMEMLHDLVLDVRQIFNNTPSNDLRAQTTKILAILTERLSSSGNSTSKKLYGFLLSRSSLPYFDIIKHWIYYGQIRDPFSEFMIEEQEELQKESLLTTYSNSYWAEKYKIKRDCIPIFLLPVKDKILLAGKYLNVLRECGVNLSDIQLRKDSVSKGMSTITVASEIRAALEDGQYIDEIETAYIEANKAFLHLLIHKQKLLERLRALKHYFLLDQSDFITHFLDVALPELQKSVSTLSITRLQSLLDLILRNSSSITAHDKYKEDLKVGIVPGSIIEQLLKITESSVTKSPLSVSSPSASVGKQFMKTPFISKISNIEVEIDSNSNETSEREIMSPSSSQGVPLQLSSSSGNLNVATSPSALKGQRSAPTGIEGFSLEYNVPFPLSLIISKRAISKYQIFFRFLFYCKYVEHSLCKSWTTCSMKRMTHESQLYKSVANQMYLLRARMLNFIQQTIYYMTIEVLERNWIEMEKSMKMVTTVEEVLGIHNDFLNTCLKESTLTSSNILKIFNKMATICTFFSTYIEESTKHLGKSGHDSISITKALDKMDLKIQHLEHTFSHHFRLFVNSLVFYSATEHTEKYIALAERLDFNQYYKGKETPGGGGMLFSGKEGKSGPPSSLLSKDSWTAGSELPSPNI